MKAFIILILFVPAMLSITAPWLNENVNDVSKLEGDMVTGNDPNEESTDQCQHCQHAGVPTRSTKLWDNQTIPYMISKWFNTRQKAIILSAIAEIEEKTCVTFVERTTHINHIFFDRMGANRACSSEVGRVGKRQYVNLTEACATHSTVLHELAHVLGCYHEHNRYDRDNYIQVNLTNVIEDRRKQYQIINQAETLFVEYKIPYDYRSITHYPEYSNSVNGEKTILSKQSYGIIPRSAGLSHFDVIKINLLYDCKDLIPNKENIVQKEGEGRVSNIETTTVTQQIRYEDDTSTSYKTTIQQLPTIQSAIKQVQTTSSTTITETSIGTTSKMTTSTTTRPISILNKEIIKAVEEGNEATVQTLLNEGADVNVRTGEYRNNTLIHIASKNGHVNVVSLLLDKGANIEVKDTYNSTPLHSAAWYGHVNVFSLLLDKGANIEARNTYNSTPLHYASFYGSKPAVLLLLDKGANIEARSISNSTPLHDAASNGRVNVVSLLLDKGANIEARNTSNWTPLHHGARYGHVNVVSLLLDKGANIEARTTTNWTPLHHGARYGHVNIVSLLLDKGTNIEARGTYNWTTLHRAAQNGHANVVSLLLDKGANIEARADNAWTPLHCAAWYGHVNVVSLLLDKGANMEAKTQGDSTPLDLAKRENKTEIVEILERKQRQQLTG